MAALQMVDLSLCNLEAMPLPVSSAALVRRLDLTETPVVRLPENMLILESIRVTGCRKLASNWLPASSTAQLHTLHAGMSNMRAVPAGAARLRRLSISGWVSVSDGNHNCTTYCKNFLTACTNNTMLSSSLLPSCKWRCACPYLAAMCSLEGAASFRPSPKKGSAVKQVPVQTCRVSAFMTHKTPQHAWSANSAGVRAVSPMPAQPA